MWLQVDTLRSEVERRHQELHDLKRNLKAWEVMCQAKDQQIAMLMERCRRLQEELALGHLHRPQRLTFNRQSH